MGPIATTTTITTNTGTTGTTATSAAPTATSKLSSSEALLWTIERDPRLRSTIIAIALVDGPPDVERLRNRLDRAVAAFPRLRQRVVPSRTGVPRWSETDGWTVDHHLTHVRVPAPGSSRQLLDLASEQAGAAFDPARPLWHVTVVDGLDGDRSALIVKLHHAVTDGVGGVDLLPIFTDLEPHPAPEPDLAATQRRRPPRRAAPSSSASLASGLVSMVGRLARDPVAAATGGPRLARSAAKFVTPAGRPLSRVTAARGLDRRLDVVDVPLADLRRAGHAVGGTLNDAFLAAAVGALRRYHERHGEQPAELRVTMPISVRRDDDDPGGNRFTPARFTVPLTVGDPAARMVSLGAIARRWRDEPAVGLTHVLAGALSQLPDGVTTTLFGSMLTGVDFTATNVPGSRERRWIAGAEVQRFYGYGPTTGSAVNFTMLSHVDTCCIGLNVDTAAIPDPEVLVACLRDELDEVLAVGRAAPRPSSPTPRPADRRPPVPSKLSALDASFLEIESPRSPMHVGALVLLEGAPLLDRRHRVRIDAVRAEVARRLARAPRMRQRAVPVPLGRPRWDDDPEFDVARHVHRVRIPAPGTRAQLEELCCRLQMRVLDRTHPLWEMWFVDGLADGSVGLVYKVHHAVVDGVSAADTFEILLADEPEAPAVAPGAPPGPPTGVPARRARPVAGAVVDDLRAAARWWLDTGAELASHPTDAFATAVGLGRVLGTGALAPTTSLERPVGDDRRLVSRSFAVRDVKAIGSRHGATVNDVVLTLVAAGLRALLLGRGDDPAGVPEQVRVLVPVSLRGDGQHDGVGNRVAALLVPVHLGEADPVAALRAVAAETGARKASPDAGALDLLLRWTDTWPVALLGPASRLLVRNQRFVNLVVTNVRGPAEPLSLLGAGITEITPIVPLGPNLTLGVAVLSYRGRLTIGLHADADSCPDVGVMADAIDAAFDDLRSR